MNHQDGEKRIKTLQKEFLAWVEGHPDLVVLDPEVFNDIRHRVFRSTFFAFRLGIIGIESSKGTGLFEHFFGWVPAIPELDEATVGQIAEKCFVTALEAFWIGALVGYKRS